MNAEGIFRVSGSSATIQELKQRFDRGNVVMGRKVHFVFSVL